MAIRETRVLLVEDSRAQAVLLQETLLHAVAARGPAAALGQLDVHWVDTLSAALEAVGRSDRPFDAVLLDLTLPDSQGGDTIERMQRAASGTPIVVLTGLADENLAMEAVRRGADDYLVKESATGRSVARAVRYAIDRKAAETALRTARDQLEQKVRERTAELAQSVTNLQDEVVQRIRAEADLNRANQTLRAVSACNEAVVRAAREDELMREICRIAVEVGGYRMAWVGIAEQDDAKSVRPVAHVGFEEDSLDNSRITWADTELGRGPTGSAIRLGQVRIGRDFLTDPELAPWREQAISRGFRSSIALPLTGAGHTVLGALTIYAAEPDAFDEEQVRVFRDMGDDLAFGLMALRTREALRENRDRLRALAAELTLVEQRERRRLAKVLHDHLQQLLVGAKFRVAIVGRTEDPLVQQGAREVEELLGEAIEASRSLTSELSPPILHEAGLPAGLEWLSRWMADTHGLFVELATDQDAVPMAEDVKVLLFESVRELLFNVVKHARTRVARVHMRRVGDHGEPPMVQIIVSDNGPGFDPGQLHRGGAARPAGFGLFSIRERLDLIGGRMEIDSQPGRGARFTLLAPSGDKGQPATAMKEKASPSSTPPVAPSPRRPLAASASGRLCVDRPARIRVLLADDHEVMRQGLARLLGGEEDIEVVGQASDGQMAVEMAQRLAPDVVVMDVSMPRINGIDAARMIHRAWPTIRVIGLSMFEEQEQAKAMLSAGASAYLTKSGPADSVLAAIRAAGTAGPAATPDADRPDRPASNRGKARRPAKRRSKVAVRRPKA